MKQIILFLSALLLLSLTGVSQEITPDKVPAQVKQTFTKMFPSAAEVKYGMEKKNFMISFKDQEAEKSAGFSSTGRWLETQTKISESDIPKKVMKVVNKTFKGYSLSDVATIESPSVEISYKMNVKNDNLGYEVQFGPKCNLMKKTPLKKEKAEKK
jgi:hypothetical protein